jgi:FkbM family methyltransferase
MAGLKRFLKRWRDDYYVSLLLAGFLKPLHAVCSKAARHMEQSIHKNGVAIRLPNGKRMWIGRNTGIGMASQLFWHGLDGYEPETSRTLRRLFEQAATFVDVGANCGLYSVLGALWNPKLKVIAFEPVPRIFGNLETNVRLNRLEGRVRCENVALSSQDGTATLFLPKVEGGLDIETTGTLVRDGWQATKVSPLLLQVKTVRFDEYEARNPMQVDLIKIDVEDFEADVLTGMRGTIERDRPFIVCEVLPRGHGNRRTSEIVGALGYQAYWITPVGYVRVPSFNFTRSQYTDFLLSPVSTGDTILGSLDVLLELRELRRRERGPAMISSDRTKLAG